MCRITLYLGPPIRLGTLLLDPSHSLIRQSVNSNEREEPLNGDGFGVGWYAPDLTDDPAVFRSITPAWNNRNLNNLARVVASPCILAHVRAATNTSGVNEANCHPFRWGRFVFAHNGDVAGFPKVRRRLLSTLRDEAFNNVYGSTDSEHLFALAIDEMLAHPHTDPAMHLGEALNRVLYRTLELVREAGEHEPSYLNLAIADGHNCAVVRFTDAPDNEPESLYFLAHQLYAPVVANGPRRRPTEMTEAVIVASERLTHDDHWQAIPPNHALILRHTSPPSLLACHPEGLRPVEVPLAAPAPAAAPTA